MHGVEKVHAEALFRTVGDTGDFGHAERRRVRGEDRRGTANLVEQGEDFDLRFHFLGNGFND